MSHVSDCQPTTEPSMTTDVAARKPILVGANPGVQLFDSSGDCTAYGSCWRVDWSTHGSGDVVVLWQPERVVAVGSDSELSLWLAESFVRYFPELEGLEWPGVEYRQSPARVQVDLATGAVARAGDIDIYIDGVLDRRCFSTDEFQLGPTTSSLQLVLGPCARASISVRDRRTPGHVRLGGTEDRPSSSAFTADAEVWSQ